MSDTRTRVAALIFDHLGKDQNDFLEPLDATFTSDLGADSLDHVELVMECEEQFLIEITDDEAEAAFTTVGEWVKLVERKIAGKAVAA